jgi:hypothetical protein
MSNEDSSLQILIDVKARLDDITKTTKSLVDLTKQTKEAGDEAGKFGSMLKQGLGIDLARRGVDLLVGSFRELVGESIRMAGQIRDTSEALSMTTEAYQVLGVVLQDVGADMGSLNEVVARQTRSMQDARKEAGTAAEAYRKLGLDVGKLEGMTVERRLEAIGKSILDAKDQTAAFGAASDILGSRNIPQLVSAMKKLAGEGYDNIAASAKAAGLIMEKETIAKLDDATKKIEKMKRAATIAVGGVAGDVVDSGMLDTLGSGGGWAWNKFKGLGQGIGSFAANTLNTWQGLPETSLREIQAQDEATRRQIAEADAAAAQRTADAKSKAAELEAKNLKRIQDAELELGRAKQQRSFNESRSDLTDETRAKKHLQWLDFEIDATRRLMDLLRTLPLRTGESRESRAATIEQLGNDLMAMNADSKFSKTGLPASDAGNSSFRTRKGSMRHKNSMYAADGVEDPAVNDGYMSMGEGLDAGAADWVSSLGSQGEQVAAAMQSTIGASVSAISDGIYGWITGTQSFGDVLQNLGATILQTLLQTIVQMGVQWVITGVIGKTVMMGLSALGSVLRTKETGETIAAESAKAPVLAANAATASAGSFGMSAVIGIALLIALMAAFAGGREKGGPVQAGSTYLVGEKRPELFVPNTSGTILPYVPQATPASAATAAPGVASSMGFSGGAAAGKPSRVVVVDNRKVADQLRDDPSFHTIIQEIITSDPRSFGIAT